MKPENKKLTMNQHDLQELHHQQQTCKHVMINIKNKIGRIIGEECRLCHQRRFYTAEERLDANL